MAGFNSLAIVASAVFLLSFIPVATPIVFGLDLGADWIKIAVVKPGKIPIQVVLNDASKRKTPTSVGYDGDQRVYGDTALTLGLRSPALTFPRVKPLLGEAYSEEYLKQFGTFHFPYELVNDTRRGTFGMKFKDTIFTPEELIAQIIDHARRQTEDFSNATVKDIVITVPSFYTQNQRQAVLDAAEIAGVNVLSLISDHTAVALKYGIDGNADTDTGRNVVFYDMGAGSTKVSLVHFYSEPDKDRKNKTIGQLQVKGVAWDQTLGGAAFTERLMDMLVKNSKQDPTGSPRAMAKIYKEAEKVKQVLSANTEFTAQIESLIGDYDFKHYLKREEFEEACKDLFDRVLAPLEKVLKDSEMTVEQVDAIEIVGGGVRVPKIQALLMAYMKRDTLDKGLNGDEAACLGAALYAASLSTAFRLRKFGVKDITPFAVSVDVGDAAADAADDGEDAAEATTSGKGKTYKLFKLHNAVPSKKLMTFGKKDDFAVVAKYDAAGGKDEEPIARYDIGGIAEAHEKYPNATKAKVNLAFRLNRNGVVEVEKAELVVEMTVMVDVEEPKVKKDKKKKAKKENKNATKDGEDKAEEKGEEKKDDSEEKKDEKEEEKDEEKDEEKKDEESKEEKKEDDGKEEEKKEGEKDEEKDDNKDEEKKDGKDEEKDEAPKPKQQKATKRVHRVGLRLASKGLGLPPLDKAAKKNSTALLKDLELKDFKLREHADVHNMLESFVYEFKEKLESPSEEVRAVATEAQLEELRAALEAAGEWLYGDGEEASTEDYRDKVSSLEALQRPIWLRVDEAERRPGMIAAARELINATKHNLAEVSLTKEWITDKLKEPAYEAVLAFEKWLNETVAKQEAVAAHEKPAFYVRDIAERYRSKVETVVTNVLHTVKPKPKPVKMANATKTKADKGKDEEAKEEAEEKDEEKKEDKKEGDKEEEEVKDDEEKKEAEEKDEL